ncbi:hypothetical protein [Aeromonas diversa]|uniref:hypothetical protein n=1 Tax=Aeromonas diversa TaxID=502790 RepID=UPI0012E080E7|nr:hypothetical protein [Aeromonas diversa]
MPPLPVLAPCHDDEFELRHLGRLGTLTLSRQSPTGEDEQRQPQAESHWPKAG